MQPQITLLSPLAHFKNWPLKRLALCLLHFHSGLTLCMYVYSVLSSVPDCWPAERKQLVSTYWGDTPTLWQMGSCSIDFIWQHSLLLSSISPREWKLLLFTLLDLAEMHVDKAHFSFRLYMQHVIKCSPWADALPRCQLPFNKFPAYQKILQDLAAVAPRYLLWRAENNPLLFSVHHERNMQTPAVSLPSIHPSM